MNKEKKTLFLKIRLSEEEMKLLKENAKDTPLSRYLLNNSLNVKKEISPEKPDNKLISSQHIMFQEEWNKLFELLKGYNKGQNPTDIKNEDDVSKFKNNVPNMRFEDSGVYYGGDKDGVKYYIVAGTEERIDEGDWRFDLINDFWGNK
jgi:hypothetical protein